MLSPRRLTAAAVSTLVLAALVAARPADPSPAPRPRARVHVVEMIHDSTGQHFTPAVVNVRPGDTVRFVNREGHHDVDFVRDSNPPGVTLPPTTPLAERSGEVFDVPINLPPGRYYFQCDPHVGMKMVGHIVVSADRHPRGAGARGSKSLGASARRSRP